MSTEVPSPWSTLAGLEVVKSYNFVPRLSMSGDLLPLPIGLHGMHRDKCIFTLPSILFICNMLRIRFEITSDTISFLGSGKAFQLFFKHPDQLWSSLNEYRDTFPLE
jgi:hypothetical protein